MNIINIADTVMNRAARYHEHRVEGLEHIPASGPALIVVNHSLATYDSGLLATAVRERLGRDVWLLGDRYIFKIPVVRDLASAYGFVEGSQHNAESLLRDGELVLVAPGGMREALRPSSQKYQLNIRDRKGFARLAMRTGAPVRMARRANPFRSRIFSWYFWLLGRSASRMPPGATNTSSPSRNRLSALCCEPSTKP